MRNIFIVFLFSFSLNSYGYRPSLSKIEYCQNAKRPNYFKGLIGDISNRTYWPNGGGLLNLGVCWWHSRFLRAAIYLTSYRPELPPPSLSEAKEIIKRIRKRKSVVEIPGYSNFRSFSKDFKEEILKTLERWQLLDGLVFQSWAIGLWGRSKTSPRSLKKKMDKLFRDVVVNKHISFQMLQFKGIAAHSWLVYDMKKINQGYIVYVIDSNFFHGKTYVYQYGDTNFSYSDGTPFVPYLQKKWELKKIKKAIVKDCEVQWKTEFK